MFRKFAISADLMPMHPLLTDPALLDYLSPEDQPFPIAFSRVPLFRKPNFGLFVSIEITRDRHSTPYLLYSICERISGSSDFDFSNPLFSDTCFESCADVWTLFV